MFFLNFLQLISLNIIAWLFLAQSLIMVMEQHVNFYVQSILGIFIFHSTFPKGEKQDDSFCFKYMRRSRDLLPTPPPAESGEKRESSPVFSLVWPSHSVGS